MGCLIRILSIIAFCAFKLTLVESITTKTSYPKDFKRHAGPKPPTDWETGLREAAHQALIRERNNNPHLRDNLLGAPIVGKQSHATPFGDIAVLARGQLLSTHGSFQFVQDPYQNDCLDCHHPCRDGNCGGYKSHGEEQLVALWTVKRIRHRDPDYGHRYELEYTISPAGAIKQGYVTRKGAFNYAIPGHVFIVKLNPKGPAHNIFKVFSPEKDDFITNANRAAQWYKDSNFKPIAQPPVNNEQYPTASQVSDINFNKPYIPGDRLAHPRPQQNFKPNHRYLPQIYYPKKTTTTQEYLPVPTQDQEEVDLYKNLVHSLSQKTSTTNFISVPTKATYPHRFGPPTKGTTPIHTLPIATLKPTPTTIFHHSTYQEPTTFNQQPTTFNHPSTFTQSILSQPTHQTFHQPTHETTYNHPTHETTFSHPPTSNQPTTYQHPTHETTYNQNSFDPPTSNQPTYQTTYTHQLPTQSTYPTTTFNHPPTHVYQTTAVQDQNQGTFLPIQPPYTTSLIPITGPTANTPHKTTLFIPASELPPDQQTVYSKPPTETTKTTYSPNKQTYVTETYPTRYTEAEPTKSSYTQAHSTNPTYISTQQIYLHPSTILSTTNPENTKPVPTFFIDPTHNGYPKTTPTTPFAEDDIQHNATPPKSPFRPSPVYIEYSEPDPTYHPPAPTTTTTTLVTERPTNRIPINTDRYIPDSTPHYINIINHNNKPNTPFHPGNDNDDEEDSVELFPEDKHKDIPLVSTESTIHSTISPKPTEGFLLSDDEYKPKKKDKKLKEDVEVFDKTTKNPKDVETITPQTINTKEIDEVFNTNSTMKPEKEDKEFDEFFVDKTKHETTTAAVKIIYSDFFQASTTSNFLQDVATTTSNPTSTISPTSLSYSTSVSIEVNKNQQNYTKVKYKKAKLTEIPHEDYNIYKAEPPVEFTTSKDELNTNKAFDDIALSLVNHARRIDILDQDFEVRPKKPKYKRKNYTRVRKLKKRVEHGVQI